jgi:hypothetical protein
LPKEAKVGMVQILLRAGAVAIQNC